VRSPLPWRFVVDTLFGEIADAPDAVRVEMRLKWNGGPFDTSGWSLMIEIGGHLQAMEVTTIPGADHGWDDVQDWIGRMITKIEVAMLPVERRRAIARTSPRPS